MTRRPLLARKMRNWGLTVFTVLAVSAAVGAMLWIIGTVFGHGLKELNLHLLLTPSRPYGGNGGIANALLGTVLITLGAAALSVIPGIAAGIYLAEFSHQGHLGAIFRFSANVMMGIPSILAGLFVYAAIVVPSGNFSGFAASAALAIIIFPVVMRTTEEMLKMVPDSLRESALALGMTRTRATLRIVCKSARSGMLTGILLSLSRVSGETAPLLFTAMYSDAWPKNYFAGPLANLPVQITEYSTNSPFEEMHRIGWSAALVVMMLVLVINLFTRICFREKKHGH